MTSYQRCLELGQKLVKGTELSEKERAAVSHQMKQYDARLEQLCATMPLNVLF